jgi:hypothetical protein
VINAKEKGTAAGAKPIPIATASSEAPAQTDGLLDRWASTASIRRLFWLSTAAFVAAEGLVGFLAILFNGFPFDAELARSLLSAILGAVTALAGLALIKRRWLDRYARASVIGAGLAFPVLVAFIWVPGGGAWSKLHWSLVVVLAGALAVSAQRLWLGDWTAAVLKRVVFLVTTVSIAVIVPVGVAAIWGGSSKGSLRALGAFQLLAFVGFLLTPILRRALRGREKAAGSLSPEEPEDRPSSIKS